jgi:membrane-bound serine protease (ClpP class)
MSFAAAICSMFCEGIVPMAFTFRSFAARSDAKLTETERFHQLSSRRLFLMRIFPRYLLLLLILAIAPQVSAAREVIQKGDTVVVPLNGEISQPLVLFLRRAVKVAESAGAGAIIFEMNTYGGRLDAAADITGILNHATIPTYTFINSNAGSAGSLIALATQHIYMSPVSAIGAAAPVLSTGEDLPATERDKTLSYWSALVRSSATRNGHNPDIGEAFMSKEKEVKIGDRVVHPKGSLLTLTAQEATEKINGKPLLADDVADSVADLVRKAGLKGQAVALDPSGFERLAFWITALAPLLLLLGIICAYLEFKIPGASLPGILAGVCFALFFLGHYLAGLAGWEVVSLFVLGLFLVLIEILFFAHSTIVIGVVGVFLMLASLLWAMIDRYPGETFFPTGQMIAIPMRNLFIAVVGAAIGIVLLARYLPRTSIYRRFALMTTNPPGPSLAGAPREFATALDVTAGMQGTAQTTLRPSGKARFAEHVIDVVTEGEFIAADTPITVIQKDGMRVVVKQAG